MDVTFPLAVSGTVSVYETNGACSSFHPGAPVTVHPLPVPTITGSASACVNSTGNIYFTEAGMSAYVWTISGGGTITAGAGTSSITVDWNTAGAQTITVNYTDANSCTASAPTMKGVSVYPLPVPTISGNNSACLNSGGNVYTTESGMSGYAWTVTGGTITSGDGTRAITINWNTTGDQTITVTYTNGNGCSAAAPATKTVTVNPLPVPGILGPNSVCLNSTGNVYSTEAGMSGYIWTVPAGGVITAGGTGNPTVTITWTTTGSKNITVNYNDANGCTAASATVYNVTVNPLPAPTITGTSPVCVNSTGNLYQTEAGMSNYLWTVTGGTITTGGGVNDATATITWNTVGAQSVSVNYTNGTGCTAASPTVKTITVNPLPVPTIAGNTSVCLNSTGNIYTTEAGMTGYTWSIVGGTITAGGTPLSNTATVTWTTAGSQSISVNYTNGNGCTAAAPVTKSVTVNDLPVPTLGGPATVCVTSVGNVYTTDPGMTNYLWIVTGGTITAGGTFSNTITVTWNTAGPQSVSVNYTNSNGCTAPAATVYPVTVNALPAPTITGPSPVCATSAGNLYQTEAGMTNYLWTVSGGTITTGGGVNDATATITWNTVGAQSVSVNYTNVNGCTAASPTVKTITVNPLPVPTIAGNTSVCLNSTGNIYTTEPGMTGYTWSISAGGTVTAGGMGTDNTVTVTWNTLGAQTVSVNYTNGNGCTAASSTVKNITVNALPVPTLTGNNSVCRNSTGNVYTTEPGMTGYVWTVSAGGTITSGGGAANSSVTVRWNVVGPQTVSVNYTNADGCTAAAATIYNVTVNALPVPTITGPASVCVNSAGNTYQTEAGMTNYLWTVSAGGVITAGGSGSDFVTVTWSSTGAKTVTVNYTDANGCTAAAATSYGVTVNALPVPTLTGNLVVCAGSTGNTYNTEGGMTGYTWSVSAGGSITAGGTPTDNTVTITWNTAGPQTVSVNYTNANGCTAVSPVTRNVTVNPLPVPTISGNASVCFNSAGNTYTTEGGMTNYTWVVTGGTVTGGGTITDNNVTVTWNTLGAQSVSVNYTNSNGCTAAAPTIKAVTVNPLPVPTLAGPASVCRNSTGNVYTTEAGMSNYQWSVSAGGVITAGGALSNTITVTWNTAGPQTVSVNYTDPNGCTAVAPVSYAVTVNPLPVPALGGPLSVCVNSTGNTYTTDAGMSNYVWVVSAGGLVTGGGTATDNTITVTWNTVGAQTVSVNYTNLNGCTAAAATEKTITVNPLPVPTIAGNASACLNSTGNIYTTEAGMSGYTWTVTGGTITSGDGTRAITITWNATGVQTISVVYTNTNGCTAAAPTTKTVTVNALPVPAIAGPAPVCMNSSGNKYTTEAGQSNYIWTVSAGGVITAGGTGNDYVTVTWTSTGAKTVTVNYTDGNGCTAATATIYNITVNALPAPTITGASPVCVNSTGNLYQTEAGMTNYLWTVTGGTITTGGGVNDATATITWNTVGAQNVSVNYTDLNGCTAASPTVKTITVNPLPVPTIAGNTSVCLNSTGIIYTTEAGMTGYTWSIVGGTITAGGTPLSNTATVTWTTAGSQSISVNYTNGNGCTAAAPVTKSVTVNDLPVPALGGPATVCVTSVGNVYTTDPGMTNYLWIVTGGTITAGGTFSNTITVTWNTAGPQSVSVNYTNSNGCTAPAATVYPVTVNALPAPTITGPSPVCATSAGNLYQTEAGMTSYLWTISGGGTVTAGGETGDNSVTITWNSTGAQAVTINYTNPAGCTASTATVKNVTVNPLPVPTISGNSSVCVNSTGNTYTTEPGMTGYTWSISAGGALTAGGTGADNTVTITWNTVGAQTVSVNYTNGNGCTAASPSVKNVTVNPLPVPALAGPTPVCVNTTGNYYYTEPGMSNYIWTIPAGATVTAGGTPTSNSVTITWTTTGAKTLSVNYTNANGCTPPAATDYNIVVNALPVPTIIGPASVCMNSTGNTYQTEAGMTNYIWTVSSGGVITAGGSGNDNVIITWTSTGAKTVTVNYINPDGCTAPSATIYNVTVNALPAPTITGNLVVCATSTGNSYLTEAGMTNYIWTVSAGGTITAGGFATDNSVTVTWNTPGTQTVSVNYTNGSGCTAASSTVKNITVNALPVPTITGNASACVNSAGNIYTTEGGMTNYTWVITGGTITAGGTNTSNTATVTWNTAGPQIISVNYTNGNGCTATVPSQNTVTVNPLPAPTISGPASACATSAGNVYTTEPGMSSYSWVVSAGGTITAGGSTSNTIIVTWNTAGPQSVSVNYINGNGCTAASSTVYNVTVDPLPVPTITGPAPVCVTSVGNVYATEPGMSNYTWVVSGGGTITAGGGTGDNSVTVTWNTIGSQTVSVNYTNATGCTASSPKVYSVTVNPLPVPVITGNAAVCVTSTGNIYTTEAGMTGYTWSITGGTITSGGTIADNTATVTWNTAGTGTISVNYTNGNGCTAASPTVKNVIVNALPVPTLTGPASVCVTSTGNTYTTESGMTNYFWTVSAGGTITGGGTPANNTIVVTWNTTGPQSVSVNYNNSNGCTAASSTIYNVTVNALPVPTITGPSPVCAASAGNMYTTEAGMTDYTWTVSAGGTITAGGTVTDNTVTVTWNTAGARSVKVNYRNANNCTAATPANYDVTVNPLPFAILSGGETICPGQTSNLKVNMTVGTGPFTLDIQNLGPVAGYVSGTDIPVTPAATTTYSLISVTDANGCIAPPANLMGSATVTVRILPAITVQPAPSMICEFNMTSFSVTATGTDRTYQWYVDDGGGFDPVTDGGIYSGATSDKLYLYGSVRDMDGYQYHVVVDNCSSPVTSNDALLTVNTIPEIRTQPSDSTVCLGAGATFSVDARGSSLTYQWQVNRGTGFGNVSDDANFSGSTLSTLTLINIPGSFNNYIFRVAVNGACLPSVTSNFVALRVNMPPTVTIQPVSKAVCDGGGPVYFTANGSGMIDSLRWQVFTGGAWSDIHDNAIYSGATTQQLALIGVPLAYNGNQYRLALMASCTTTYTNGATLTVNSLPVITFAADPINACGGIAQVITPNITGGSGTWSQHTWTGDVGPLNNYFIQSPTFRTQIAGPYNLNYKVKDSNGCYGEKDVQVIVDAPDAMFTQDVPNGCTPVTVNFTKDMTGIASFTWDFGDGTPVNTTTASPSHVFTNATASTILYRTVKLTVVSAGGCTATYSSMVTVYPAIDATFTADKNVVCSGGSITFTGLPGASTYSWDYGDGATGPGGSATTHLYTNFNTAPEIRTVTLTTTSFYGCQDTKTLTITVMPVPIPQFTATPVLQTYLPAGNPVSFTNETNAGAWTWAWDFGDGGTSTAQNPSHTYTTLGTFSVKLDVTNGTCSANISHFVTVMPEPPIANFDSIPSGCSPLEVSINNTTVNLLTPGNYLQVGLWQRRLFHRGKSGLHFLYTGHLQCSANSHRTGWNIDQKSGCTSLPVAQGLL